MSLTSMIDSKEHRELFKGIAAPKVMFRSLTQDPPFSKAEPRTPGRFQLPESSLIGMAFDYLLRAQVARWNGDSWERTVPWVATHGMEALLTTSYGEEGTPMIRNRIEGLTDELGNLMMDVIEKFFSTSGHLAEEEVETRQRLCVHYMHAYDRWVQFISGGANLEIDLLNAVWFLAKLEVVYRAGGTYGDLLTSAQVDTAGTSESPQREVIEDIEALWDLLATHKGFFTETGFVTYNPSFGEASMMVGGADADLVVGTTLVDIKTTVKWGYSWADAAQLAGYYVFAAMVGEPWPIDRLAIYRSRFGRIEYVDCDELRQSIDLLGFAEQLMDIRASSLNEDIKLQEKSNGKKMAAAAIEEHEQRSARLLENARKHLE